MSLTGLPEAGLDMIWREEENTPSSRTVFMSVRFQTAEFYTRVLLWLELRLDRLRRERYVYYRLPHAFPSLDT